MASKKKGGESGNDDQPATSLLDVDALRRIVELLETTEVTKLSWRRGPERLLITRGHGPAPIVQVAPANPESPPFVEIGQQVAKGQVLCIVEAMKLMNEIEADEPGKITEILVENGQPVEFGQPLFRIEPA